MIMAGLGISGLLGLPVATLIKIGESTNTESAATSPPSDSAAMEIVREVKTGNTPPTNSKDAGYVYQLVAVW